jgi:hypothetical protein
VLEHALPYSLSLGEEVITAEADEAVVFLEVLLEIAKARS